MNRNDQRQLLLEQAKELIGQFDLLFPCDASAFEELCRIVGSPASSCRTCEQHLQTKIEGQRTLDCSQCNDTSWRTAGTFFDNVRKPRAWLATIWLLGHGILLGSPALAKLIGTSQSTALVIMKRFAMVINNAVPEGAAGLDSSTFASLICRRSRLTPAEKHPVAEEARMQQLARQKEEAASQLEAKRREEQEKLDAIGPQARTIYNWLSEEPMWIEDLIAACKLDAATVSSVLTLMQLSGLVTALPSNHFARGLPPCTFKDGTRLAAPDAIAAEPVRRIIESVKEFVYTRCDGTSRKYLQLCLALFWCCDDTGHWGFASLLSACALSPPITYDDILEFISPPILRLALEPGGR